MTRIAITVEAYQALVATLPLGSVAYEPESNAKGERVIWLREVWLSKLNAMRKTSSCGSLIWEDSGLPDGVEARWRPSVSQETGPAKRRLMTPSSIKGGTAVAPIIAAASHRFPICPLRLGVSRRQKPSQALDHRAHPAAPQCRQ